MLVEIASSFMGRIHMHSFCFYRFLIACKLARVPSIYGESFEFNVQE